MTETKPRHEAPCPICGKRAAPRFAPFCSPRCADIDLGRWLTGQYVIPAREDDADHVADDSSEAG